MTDNFKGVYSARRKISALIAIFMIVGMFAFQSTAASVADRPASEFIYHGLLAQAFRTTGSGANVTFTGTSYGFYVDNEINFGTMEDVLQARCGVNDEAGMRWTGWIVPPETGVYEFRCYSDNGSRLWIGDDGASTTNAIINYWNSNSWWDQTSTPTSWSSSVTLTAGRAYYFRLDYFEYSGGSNIRLVWRNNQGMTERLVPASAYYLPETYTGPKMSSMDVSGAQLDLDVDDTSGVIVLNGADLTGATARLTTSSGKEIAPMVVSSNTGTVLTVEVPSGLAAGMYRILVTGGGFEVPAPELFFVSVAGGQLTERPEHPRPDRMRDQWMNLNGWWDFNYDPAGVGLEENWETTHGFTQKINVPFGWTTELSGVTNTGYRGEAWYQKTFTVDETWTENGKQVYVYFGAVDNWARVFINGHEVQMDTLQYYLGEYIDGHRGGYTPIEFNLTQYLNPPGVENTLSVWVEDKAIYGVQSYVALVGKQGREAPCGYNQTGGIWQTVMLESRGQTSLGYVHANPKVNSGAVDGSVVLDVEINNKYSSVPRDVTVDFQFTPKKYNPKTNVDEVTGDSISGTVTIPGVPAGQITEYIGALTIQIPNQKLWDDVDPNLYYGSATLKIGGQVVDTLNLYFGQRELDIRVQGTISGNEYSYININGRPVYLSGLLDQGFWIEGLYTAESEAALKYDISAMKDRGFNMIRKHLKIEDPLEYTWADKLGFFIWQDIPHANAMMISQYTSTDRYAPGRDVYLDCLDGVLRRDYNRPSVIAIILFNETWGISRGSGAATANTHPASLKQEHTYTYTSTSATNHTTRTLAAGSKINAGNENDWLASLYWRVKETRPGTIVEDMSVCNNDHLNPTDINTWHDYSKGYSSVLSVVTGRESGAYLGSTNNFRTSNNNNSLGAMRQQGQPLLNSEYGSVGYGDWDYDISWCFKYYTDILRQQVKGSGYVYTEPHDIENERNGILTWERYDKIMGYEDVAWGGDMSIVDLNQPNYVGIDGNPNTTATPGSTFSRNAVAMNWSGNLYPGATLNWRFDATDGFGNQISTGLSGSTAINYTPYTQRTQAISFQLPPVRCVGTLTVWIEDSAGNKIAKNFQNVLVRPAGASISTEIANENSYVLRQSTAASNTFTNTSGSGQTVYNFTVPTDFDPADLNNIRLFAEISSIKPQTTVQDRYLPTTHSDGSQTAVGYEKPSDMTISINGHEVETVDIPDNPRDTRGSQALGAMMSGASAGNFGYLVNLNLSDALIATLKAELATNKTLAVTYSVKGDAENKNGLRVYSETNGRWAVMPTLFVNPLDEYAVSNYPTSDMNYAVETTLAEGQSFTVRGGAYTIARESGQIVLKQGTTTLGAVDVDAVGGVDARIRLFDTKITLWVDNNPDPAITIYDDTPATTGDVSGAGLSFVISPETYAMSGSGVPEAQPDVQIVNSFNNNGTGSGVNQAAYASYAGGNSGGSSSTWTSAGTANNLTFTASDGGKIYVPNSSFSDGVVECDITLTSTSGNCGLLVRANNFTNTTDGVDGYYVGVGRNGSNNFVQVGRMNQGWTELSTYNITGLTLTNTKHRLSVVLSGPRIMVYLDGVLRRTVYDSTYASGSVGFRTYQATGNIDNLVISTAPRYFNDFSNNSSAAGPGNDSLIANFTSHAITKNNVWSVSGNRLAASGAGAALVGDYGWSDYQYSATIRPTSDTTNAGLMVRGFLNAGAENGYIVTLNRATATTGKIQLLRASKGATSVLAEKDFTFANNNTTDYPVIVRVVNNTIRVYANTNGSTAAPSTAKPLMKVVDNSYPTGMAGVISLNGAAAFDSLDVRDKFVWQEEFYDGALTGWNMFGNGNATVADNELTLVQNANGFKITDGYATWENYTIKADIKLLIRTGKSNGGFTYLSTDFGAGQDDLRGYVTGINYNTSATPNPNEHTGAETGAIHYGWTALTNTAVDQIEFDPNEWHSMEITVASTGSTTTTISATVDDELCYSYTTPANRDFHYGQIAARVFNSDMQLRNLRVIPFGETEPVLDFAIAGTVLAGTTGVTDMSGFVATLYDAADVGFTTPLDTAAVAADGNYAFTDRVIAGQYVVVLTDTLGIFAPATVPVNVQLMSVTDADFTLTAGSPTGLTLIEDIDGSLVANIALDSASGGDSCVMIIIAVYDAAGRLLKTETSTGPVRALGEFMVFEALMDDVPATAATAKAFVWDSKYAPLVAAALLTLEE